MISKPFSKLSAFLMTTILLTLGSCRTQEKLPALGKDVAGAADIVNVPGTEIFYALNSDYERRYDKGSILVVDVSAPKGQQRINAISTPRMGRSLSISQNLLLVTYGDPQAKLEGSVEIYNIQDPKNPVLVANLKILCQPLNGILAPTQPYFTVSCVNGELFIGKNPANTAAAPLTFDHVRDYGFDRHALYFYETGGKTYLFGFSTDLNSLDYVDVTLLDAQTYDIATDSMINGSNGVPDVNEDTPEARRRYRSTSPYQMFIYSVTDEEEASKGPQDPLTPPFQTFRYIPTGTFLKPSKSDLELHYVTYDLFETSGQVIPTEQVTTPNTFRFRTNFWDAKIGPENNPSIFYLSQRGDYGAENNNIMRVTINDAALANPDTAKFSDLFQFGRVYGYLIDHDNRGRYPGSFAFTTIKGQPMLLINSFRDLIYFASAPFYSITRKFLDNPDEEHTVPDSTNSTDFHYSYFQLAVSPSGKVLTSSYYGNALFLFDADPDVSMLNQIPVPID